MKAYFNLFYHGSLISVDEFSVTNLTNPLLNSCPFPILKANSSALLINFFIYYIIYE